MAEYDASDLFLQPWPVLHDEGDGLWSREWSVRFVDGVARAKPDVALIRTAALQESHRTLRAQGYSNLVREEADYSDYFVAVRWEGEVLLLNCVFRRWPGNQGLAFQANSLRALERSLGPISMLQEVPRVRRRLLLGPLATHWRLTIQDAYATENHAGRVWTTPRFAPGVSPSACAAVEAQLGVSLPADLRRLLLESDGITELLQIGEQPVESGWLVWPLARIAFENLRMREAFGTRSTLLVFASAGADGVVFAYDVSAETLAIVACEPQEEVTKRLADSLLGFLLGWIGGTICV